MKANLIFLLTTLFISCKEKDAIKSEKQVFDEAKELSAILQVIDKETDCFFDGNYECWASKWSHGDYASQSWNNDDGSVDAAFGWDKINAQNALNLPSDRRLKHNIKDLKYGLMEILQLNPKSYIYNADSTNKTKLGLIAQEVKLWVPEAVEGDETIEMLSMTYETLVPVLINAMKEQQDIIDQLQKELSTTTSSLIDIKAEIDEIKNVRKQERFSSAVRN